MLVFTTPVGGARHPPALATATLRRRGARADASTLCRGSIRCVRLKRASRRWGIESVDAPQGRCGARPPPPPHRIRLTWLGSHRAGPRQSNDTQQLTLLCPKTLSSGERTTLSPVHDQKPRGSHRLSCASATCNSLRRQATGPQQRKGESSPNPRSCVRLTQVFRSLQARKVLKASSSCA
jgi:hypothetical protein